MSPRSYPKRAKATERGAAVFIVVLAITLLTAVGMFAAHSATMVDQASGYARLARQTQHLSELGTVVAAAELGSGTAEPYVRQMAARTDECRSNAGRLTEGDVQPPCYKLFYSQLNARTMALANESLIEPTDDTVAGSLGYTISGVSGVVGDFVVELTDPGPTGAPVAGTDLGGTGTSFRHLKVTATSIAQLRPPGVSCTDDEDEANAIAVLTSQQSMRAHLVIGPIPQ